MLVEAIKGSKHPVALVVVGQFDPFEDLDTLRGLENLLGRVGDRVFVHRTDMVAVHAVARGALGAAVGSSAGLRHTVPAGQFPGRRKKNTAPSLSIFVPGINAFVDLDTLDGWYVDSLPDCAIRACDNHPLTDFSQRDRPAAAAHNCAGVLEIVQSLADVHPYDRSAWLSDYWAAVAIAYDLLRVETGRRDIRPYGAQGHLIGI